MTRIARFAVVGALAVSAAVALALAAGSEKAKVGDLVSAIAAKKGVSTTQVRTQLESRGRKLDLNATLDQSLAASILSDLGVPLQASRRTDMSVADVSRLGSLFSMTRVSAEDNGDGDGEVSPCDDERDPGQVCNRGRKTRAGGNSPNSNADINAFETLRDDPRE